MSRQSKPSKFSIRTTNTKKSGHTESTVFLGINLLYEGGGSDVTAQDLIDFLGEKKIDPRKVILGNAFVTIINKK